MATDERNIFSAKMLTVPLSALLFALVAVHNDNPGRTVQKGETLHGIHHEENPGLTCEAFRKMNRHIRDENGSFDRIYPGDHIHTVPSSPSEFMDGDWVTAIDDYANLFARPPDIEVSGRHMKSARTPADIGLQYQSVKLSTTDSLELAGQYTPTDGDDAALLLHGTGLDKSTMLPYTKFLHEAGYAVLQIDFRGHGDSEGHTVTYGAHETRDVKAALRFLREKGKDDIGVLGTSLGAATGLMAAAEHDGIDAIVAESPYADFGNTAAYNLSRLGVPEVLGPPVADVLQAYATVSTGANYFDTEPVDAVDEVSSPVFYIHGNEDTITPPEATERLFDATTATKKKWIVEGAGHVPSHRMEMDQYRKKVIHFFENYVD